MPEPSLLDRYDRLLAAGIEALTQYRTVLAEARANPAVILTGLYRPELQQPYFAFPTQVIRHSKELAGEGSKVTYQDVQAELFQQVATYLGAMDPAVEFRLETPYMFPSRILITYQQVPVLAFSIYRHTYVDRREPWDETLSRSISQITDSLLAAEQALMAWEAMRDHPERRIRSLSDLWYYLTKGDAVRRNAAKTAERLQQRIRELEEHQATLKAELRKFADIKTARNQKFAEWKERLETQFGYTEEEPPLSLLFPSADASAAPEALEQTEEVNACGEEG